jgi:PhnB protein
MSAGGSPVSLFVYVADVDKLHARAIAAGAKELVAPNDQYFGARTTVVLDPDGHQWMFAQHKKEVSVEDMTKAIRTGHV